MGTGHAVVLMPRIHRERAVRKDDRLVHVVPEAAHAHLFQIMPEQVRPPAADGRGREIRKIAESRPDFLRQKIALRPPAEIIPFQTLRPNRIGGVDLHAGIHDQDRLHAVLLQRADHPRRIGEIVPVPRKPLLLLHVMVVQMDGVARDAQVPEPLHQVIHGLVRIIAPFGLVVAQRPQRRQFGRAGKARVGGYDVQRAAVVNEIIIHQAAERPESQHLFIRGAEVEVRAARIVKQQAVRLPFPQAEEKRNALVERIRFLVKIIMVRPPHGEILAPQVQGAGLVPQPEKMLRVLKPFPYPHAGVPRPVLGLPAKAAFIRQQGFVRDNIVKIHLLLLRTDANPQQGRFNDMHSGFVILPDLRAGSGIPGADGIAGLIFRHWSGEIRHADNSIVRKAHAESYFRNRIGVFPFDETPPERGRFSSFRDVGRGAH